MKNKKAFTLIELLVVIAIIGLLATLSVLALNNARAKSRDAKRVADIKQMQTALELYFNDKQSYPTSSEMVSSISSYDPTSGTSTYMQVIQLLPILKLLLASVPVEMFIPILKIVPVLPIL